MNSLPHESFMQRCLDLAALGQGHVAPNPMVGAVLVHEGRIIGEGYHRVYGQAHAEVNCVKSVAPEMERFISQSTMYVSLEPCAHHGKTPPCTDLIISQRIPRVVVGCMDSFSAVSGRGIKLMQDAGIEVITGVLEKECRELNKRFFTFHEKQRPYIILKWAQSPDGYIAPPDGTPVRISHPYTDRLVHQWRSHETGIMVGTRTAIADNPQLTTRLWAGNDPVRLVVDRRLKVPKHYHLRDGAAPTVFITEMEGDPATNIRLDFEQPLLPQLLPVLYEREIQSVMVEGGPYLLQQFIEGGYWDEARIITGQHTLGSGLPAPVLTKAVLKETIGLHGDRVAVYYPATT